MVESRRWFRAEDGCDFMWTHSHFSIVRSVCAGACRPEDNRHDADPRAESPMGAWSMMQPCYQPLAGSAELKHELSPLYSNSAEHTLLVRDVWLMCAGIFSNGAKH